VVCICRQSKQQELTDSNYSYGNNLPELISSNARHGEHLPELVSNVQSTAHLGSIETAIALLNAPEELQAEIKEQLAQGKTFTEAEIKAAAKQRKTLFLYRLWPFLWSIRFVFASSY
jgi:hypothetical protein